MNPLSPFGILYGRIMDLRNFLYDRDALKSYSLGARTISVGNITAGGTGKTPLVAAIAEILLAKGETVCILTRGYGRDNAGERVLVCDGRQVLASAAEGGDEPVELAYKLNGKAVIVADADRVSAGQWAKKEFGISAFILDDGFQHRRVKRDIDIACIDATDPCGNGRMIPAGRLRESLRGLARADAIVITRTEQADDAAAIKARLRRRNPLAPIFMARTSIKGLTPINELSKHRQTATEQRLFAFCGIGNPKNFVRTLEDADNEIAGSRAFPDHHRFSQNDIFELEKELERTNSTALVTTGKDAVKLAGMKFRAACFIAFAETLIDDLEAFENLMAPRR